MDNSENKKKNKKKKIVFATTASVLLLGATAATAAITGIIISKRTKLEKAKKEATNLVNAIPDDYSKKQGLLEKLKSAKTYEEFKAISKEAKEILDEIASGKEDPKKVEEAKQKALEAINRLNVDNKLKSKLLDSLNKEEIKIFEIQNIEQEAEKEYNADRSRRVSENNQTENYLSVLINSIKDQDKANELKDKLDLLKNNSDNSKQLEQDLNNLASFVKDKNKSDELKEKISEIIVTPTKEALLKKAELDKLATLNLESTNQKLNDLKAELEKAIENANDNPASSLRKLAEIQKKIEEAIREEDGEQKLLAAKKEMIKDRINSSTLSDSEKKSEIAKIEATTNEKEFGRASTKLEAILDKKKIDDVKELEKTIEEAILSSTSQEELLKIKKDQLKEKINSSTLLPSEKEKLLSEVDKANSLSKFDTTKGLVKEELEKEKQRENSKEVDTLLNSIENEVENQLATENKNTSKSVFDVKKEVLIDLVNNSSLSSEEKEKLLSEANSISKDSDNSLEALKELTNKVNKDISFNNVKNEALKIANTIEEPRKSELRDKINNLSSEDSNELQKLLSEAQKEANSEDKKDELAKAIESVKQIDSSNPKKQALEKMLEDSNNLSLSELRNINEQIQSILDSKEESQVIQNKNDAKLVESLIEDIKDPKKKEELKSSLDKILNSNLDNSSETINDLNRLASKVSNPEKVAQLKEKIAAAVVTPEEKLNTKKRRT
ncbi:Uncharacterised protein [Mycoplasmopsis maculosa]|uniref:Uncharacterized protein n=1 Tax=Mycoplasmopsis maculosa TaxID=114885 RepID=A0A449B530_9BACT|nr:hypothetical protein [Mycoplasmopsis maculosa]VEU75700.1 Uncharacterised protein [Mycoplasmopsis maculosa]